jgi:hypothetical protein
MQTSAESNEDIVVHTIDSRGNTMLEVMQGYFGLTSEEMRREILSAVQNLTNSLQARGIKYADLRATLTPQADKKEIALLFDTTKINSAWYGLPIHTHLLSLLTTSGSHSILLGDLIGDNHQQSWIRQQLLAQLSPSATQFTYQHSTQFYCIYMNNCSDEMVRNLHSGFNEYAPYIGYIDVTYSSIFKTYLSMGLVGSYIKFRQYIIQGHEEDLPEDTNQNTAGFPFEEFDFRCKSVSSTYYDLLLSYKIERPVFEGFEGDQIHSLNAVTSNPIDIAKSVVEIDDRKLEYLYTKKTGTIKRLGILGQPKAVLEDLIREKLRSNYLYNMIFRPNYSVATFNILLELEAIDTGDPVRVVASFAFEEERNAIRLVTLF